MECTSVTRLIFSICTLLLFGVLVMAHGPADCPPPPATATGKSTLPPPPATPTLGFRTPAPDETLPPRHTPTPTNTPWWPTKTPTPALDVGWLDKFKVFIPIAHKCFER